MGINQSTTLHDLLKKNKIKKKSVLELIKRGAIIDEIEEENLWTPLMVAAKKDYEITLKILIDVGANVNYKDRNGFTPLHIAAKEANCEILDILIAANADINAVNNFGNTPLMEACNSIYCTVFILKTLTKISGINLNCVNNAGETALAIAKRNKDHHYTEFLSNIGCLYHDDSINNLENITDTPRFHTNLENIINILELYTDLEDQYNNQQHNNRIYPENEQVEENNILVKKCIKCRKLSKKFNPIYDSRECLICCEKIDVIIAFDCGHLNCCKICFDKLEN